MGWILQRHMCPRPMTLPDKRSIGRYSLWQCDECNRYWVRDTAEDGEDHWYICGEQYTRRMLKKYGTDNG